MRIEKISKEFMYEKYKPQNPKYSRHIPHSFADILLAVCKQQDNTDGEQAGTGKAQSKAVGATLLSVGNSLASLKAKSLANNDADLDPGNMYHLKLDITNGGIKTEKELLSMLDSLGGCSRKQLDGLYSMLLNKQTNQGEFAIDWKYQQSQAQKLAYGNATLSANQQRQLEGAVMVAQDWTRDYYATNHRNPTPDEISTRIKQAMVETSIGVVYSSAFWNTDLNLSDVDMRLMQIETIEPVEGKQGYYKVKRKGMENAMEMSGTEINQLRNR